MIKLRNNQGITLIELILVIALISIILTIAVPKSDFFLNYREKKELMNFKNNIVYARNNAILESTLYKVEIRPNNNYYIIEKFSDKWERVKREDLESGLRFEADYLERIEVIFNPTGAPRQGASIFLVNRKEEKIKLTIAIATGKVTIYYDGDIKNE